MKYLITLLFAALTLNAVGQTNPNYNPDYDADGFISVNDVLGVLSTFGDTWDSGDVIVGCTYPAAVEYNPSANVDDGSCTFPVDCAGVLNGTSVVDECGVCGGGGIADGACDCAGDVLDECGVCGGGGIADGACDCAGNVLDECGVCNDDASDDCVQDECGVWGGDNSCLDACGVPNGDNSTCLDECGGPNGGNSSCADCAGVANGTSVLDECGTFVVLTTLLVLTALGRLKRRPCFSRRLRLQHSLKSETSVGFLRTVVTFQKCRLQVKEVIQIHTSTFMVTKEQMRQLLCQLPTTRLMESLQLACSDDGRHLSKWLAYSIRWRMANHGDFIRYE